MDFIDKLKELASRTSKQLDAIQTEEATKNALIMPFIAALGYNVFDPTEVTPELNADIGLKKGEKVDYAILRDGKPIILIECKHHGADLGKVHASQLYRYFSVTEARFGVLTNGINYWFYTDLVSANKMDTKPFFEFNIFDIKDNAAEELKKFSKTSFDLDNILTTAKDLKYTKEIKKVLLEELQNPSDTFVRFIADKIAAGRMTQSVKSQFVILTSQAFKQVINDQINDRLKTALASDSGTVAAKSSTPAIEEQSVAEDDIVTTQEELDGFYIVRSILREDIPVGRIFMRDVKSYCGILLDNNNRKPLCRLHFNGTKKQKST